MAHIIPARAPHMAMPGISTPLAASRRGLVMRGLLAAALVAGAVTAFPGGLPPAHADTSLPAARDLRASAAQAARHGQPLVLMFSLPGCAYCEQLRRSTYRWMVRDGIDVEQLEMVPSYRLRDFDGRPTNGQALAERYRVRLAPTVLFLGPAGQELGERLVGAGEPDFYQAYVDRSMQQARARLRGG